MGSKINQNVASCRKLAELKQSDVAEKLNIKISTYSQMERKGNITADMILKLAELFKVHPNVLLYGTDYDETQTDSEGNLKFREPITPPIPEPSSSSITVHTNSEENIIKIIRNLSKSDRDDVYAFIEAKYKKRRK